MQLDKLTPFIFDRPANPAAGVGIYTWTIPAGEQWNIKSMKLALTTSAAVANRTVMATLRASYNGALLEIGGKLQRMPVTVQTAGTTLDYAWIVGMPADNTLMSFSIVRVNMPDIWLPPQSTIEMYVDNVQAGDQMNFGGGGIFYQRALVK